MNRTRSQILAFEKKWAVPAGVATLLAVVLLLGSNFANQVHGTGDAEVLRSTYEHKGSVTLTGILQTLGFVLLALPLFYLFRADQARSPRVRSQLIGLVLIAPLFLAVSSALTIGIRHEAADQFVNGTPKSSLSITEVKGECAEELKEKGAEDFAEKYEPKSGETASAACERTKVEDNRAEHATSEASLAALVSGLGLAGGLGLIAVFIYVGLWAFRTGLLSRFWGTLGMVSGVAFILGPLIVVTLAWLVYLGFLLVGRVPGGKPPAWAAGEAIPWPTPGEKAAAELQPEEGEVIDADAIDVDAVEEEPLPNGNGTPPDAGGAPRKRKRRDP
ncbi:MAG TPA: hypothetical protein VMT37_07350 [Solirubrobacterales bacterium]|nr:hypothetical protein [Solirubrobacterales bacterium]